MLNSHGRGEPQSGTTRPQRSGIGEKNKGKITISLGRCNEITIFRARLVINHAHSFCIENISFDLQL